MAPSITVGGKRVAPGEMQRIEIPVARLPTHTMLHLPVTVLNGRKDGASLWLSAAIHGDEINGVEIIRRVLDRVTMDRLRGRLLAVAIVNVFGFITQSRYLPDRRDLNRSFPGSTTGSLSARLARLFMAEVVEHCTHGIDLHTAASPRTNLPQIRANLSDPETRRCAEAFGAPVMLGGKPPARTLRAVTTRRGIPTLLFEAGESSRFNEDAIRMGVEGVLRVMAELEMIPRTGIRRGARSVEATRSRWVRASQSGVAYVHAALGNHVERGDRIATIADPLGESAVKVRAPASGFVIGLTSNPLVHRGDAILHLASDCE
jgi:predicted deacylase